MKQITWLVFALFVGLVVLGGSGCSAIGFGIGALSDSNNTKNLEISNEKLPTLTPNSLVRISLKNGQQMEGQFLLYMPQKAGEQYLENILWLDEASNKRVSTQISEIDRITVKQQQNRKYWGLVIGGIIDATIIAAIYIMDRIFQGFSFFQ
jgi:hypothetical protein